MSKEAIEFAELHSPLFVKTGEKTGKNLGMKISENHHRGVELVYDRSLDELHVTYEGRTTYVPKHNIASMWPLETPAAKQGGGGTTAPKIQQQFSAQVSSPQSHVHAGPGAGKTRS